MEAYFENCPLIHGIEVNVCDEVGFRNTLLLFEGTLCFLGIVVVETIVYLKKKNIYI
jgi:hypothetical protein